jgi:hypothetical protein
VEKLNLSLYLSIILIQTPMRPLIILVLLFNLTLVEAQLNLVPNPSFEDTVYCPVNLSGMYGEQIYALTDWFPSANSPDYLSSCATNQTSNPINGFGFQYPKSGIGYVGFYTITNFSSLSNYREYLGVQLKQNLQIGTKYYFKGYVSAAFGGPQGIKFFSNNIGVKLSTIYYEAQFNMLNPSNVATAFIDTIVSDTSNWVPFQFSFIADSTYQYLYLGNFFDDLNTDSIQAFGTTNGIGAYYFMDDLCLSTDSNYCETWTSLQNIEPNEVQIFPNPVQDYFQFQSIHKIEEIIIYDSRGRFIKSELVNSTEGRIYLGSISDGIYVALFKKEKSISLHKFLKF